MKIHKINPENSNFSVCGKFLLGSGGCATSGNDEVNCKKCLKKIKPKRGSNSFIEEVKAAVSGRWPSRNQAKPRNIHKTPEEIYGEVNDEN